MPIGKQLHPAPRQTIGRRLTTNSCIWVRMVAGNGSVRFRSVQRRNWEALQTSKTGLHHETVPVSSSKTPRHGIWSSANVRRAVYRASQRYRQLWFLYHIWCCRLRRPLFRSCEPSVRRSFLPVDFPSLVEFTQKLKPQRFKDSHSRLTGSLG